MSVRALTASVPDMDEPDAGRAASFAAEAESWPEAPERAAVDGDGGGVGEICFAAAAALGPGAPGRATATGGDEGGDAGGVCTEGTSAAGVAAGSEMPGRATVTGGDEGGV